MAKQRKSEKNTFIISIEGIDGSGKSTQAELLYEYLSKKLDVMLISFPTRDNDYGKLIQQYLKNPNIPLHDLPDPYEMGVLFMLDRYHTLKNLDHIPDVFIFDRYIDSMAIYEGANLSGNNRKKFLKLAPYIESEYFHIPTPDITIMLDMDPIISSQLLDHRYKGDPTKRDRNERNHQYQVDCRDCAFDLANSSDRWTIIRCFNEKGPLKIETIKRKVRTAVTEHDRFRERFDHRI